MSDMDLVGRGSTATIFRLRPGVILTTPRQVTKRIANNFLVERQILSALGEHPRIMKFVLTPKLSCYSPGTNESIDFLAGNETQALLKAYSSRKPVMGISSNIDLYQHNDEISLPTRKIWCRQAVESIVYLHTRPRRAP